MLQEILDGNILLKTIFVKKTFPSSGYGGDWAVRISVEDIRFTHGHVICLIFVRAVDHVWLQILDPR